MDIVAIYTIATKIFHCTSACMHQTYVVAKKNIATLALVIATAMVVASRTDCNIERRSNKPALSQLNTIRCDGLLPLTYMQRPEFFSNDPIFCCVSLILQRKWDYCDNFGASHNEHFLVVAVQSMILYKNSLPLARVIRRNDPLLAMSR